MGLACVRSVALVGIEAAPVEVEVHVTGGLPAFHIVGLPQAAVRESADRVRAAMVECGFEFPNRRITCNLAPADLPKDSGRFDLPIAVGVLVASGQLGAESLGGRLFIGELSLSGQTRAVRGALAIALAIMRGRLHGAQPLELVLPQANAREVSVMPGLEARLAADLPSVFADLSGAARLPALERSSSDAALEAFAEDDFADVQGLQSVKRALEIAAAGEHNVLLVGPAGAGKSMLAHRLPGILPPLDESQALEAGAIASLAGGFDVGRWRRRAFRAPHHSATAAALVGGGLPLRPGEASLAHHGVLFLDELPEFRHGVLDALREPLETGRIALARAARRLDLPASFQLVAAMNPCPCGHHGSPRCRCTPDQVHRYQQRLSGPLLDRLDMHLWVDPAPVETLTSTTPAERSAEIAVRVERSRRVQLARQGCTNARLDAKGVRTHCTPTDAALALLQQAARHLGWSSRVAHRIQKMARTVADLAGATEVGSDHVAEAIGLRRALGLTNG